MPLPSPVRPTNNPKEDACLRHFPKYCGRPPKGVGDWEKLGLPFPPLLDESADKARGLKAHPQRKKWRVRYASLEEKRAAEREHQRTYRINNKDKILSKKREYQLRWYKATKDLPPLPTEQEEANSRDRYFNAPMPYKCPRCNTWTVDPPCMDCRRYVSGFVGLSDKERRDIRFPLFSLDTKRGWASSEATMSLFIDGICGIDALMNFYIPPPMEDTYDKEE